MTEGTRSPAPNTSGPGRTPDEPYPIALPPAMYAGEILSSRDFAEAMGYAWLHDEESDFVTNFREQVRREAEIYERWLKAE